MRINAIENADPRNENLSEGYEFHREELEKLREKNLLYSPIKSENDRLAERIFNEIHYKSENEARANNELEKIKQTISYLDQNLINAKEIQMKKELGDLSVERKALANLEKELLSDIIQFREIFNNSMGNKNKLIIRQSQLEKDLESQKLNSLLKRKEQIDIERLRMTKNLEKIMKGDFMNIHRNVSNLLREEQAKIMKSQLINLPVSDSLYLQTIIRNSSDKIKHLRVYFNPSFNKFKEKS